MIQKPSLRATIKAMQPGDVERIPLEMFSHNTVRNCACNLGYDLMRKFSVHVDRENAVSEVTRIQ